MLLAKGDHARPSRKKKSSLVATERQAPLPTNKTTTNGEAPTASPNIKKQTKGLLGKLKSTQKVGNSLEAVKEAVSQKKKLESEKPAPLQTQAPAPVSSNLPDDVAPLQANKPSLEAVTLKMKAFAQQLKGKGASQITVTFFESSPLSWAGNHEVEIAYENPILKDTFRDYAPQANKFLSEQLGYSVQLTAKLTQFKQENKMYTERDKLNFLTEKYPLFEQLKNELGLDLDS